MEDSKTAFPLPEDFDPTATADFIRGLTDAIHHFLLEGPGTARVIPTGDKAGLNALIEQLQAEVHALHDWLSEIENSTTLELPRTEADFEAVHVKHARKDEIREPVPIYSIR